MVDFAYEYNFINEFDMNIFSAGPVSDDAFLEMVKAKTDSISDIIKYNSGLSNFSTVAIYNGNMYKITVSRG